MNRLSEARHILTDILPLNKIGKSGIFEVFIFNIKCVTHDQRWHTANEQRRTFMVGIIKTLER